MDYVYQRNFQNCEKNVSVQILFTFDSYYVATYASFKHFQISHEEFCEYKSYGFQKDGHGNRPEKLHVLCSSRDEEGRS